MGLLVCFDQRDVQYVTEVLSEDNFEFFGDILDYAWDLRCFRRNWLVSGAKSFKTSGNKIGRHPRYVFSTV